CSQEVVGIGFLFGLLGGGVVVVFELFGNMSLLLGWECQKKKPPPICFALLLQEQVTHCLTNLPPLARPARRVFTLEAALARGSIEPSSGTLGTGPKTRRVVSRRRIASAHIFQRAEQSQLERQMRTITVVDPLAH